MAMTVTEEALDEHVAGIDRTSARGFTRFDWGVALLSSWLVGGFYVDLWAHRHGMVDETFFTPWHALLYAGAATFGTVLAVAGLRAIRRGAPWRRALPGPYRLSFVGTILFAVAGVADLGWHMLFGFEVDTEALLSPTHLLLATSGLLMIGGPIRSIRTRSTDRPAWRSQGPAIITLALGLAVFGAFTQYAHPVLDPWAQAFTSSRGDPPAQLYLMAADGSGQRRISIADTDERSPTLSPDGSRLAFVRSEHGRDRIYVARADGSDERELAGRGNNGRPAWSPGGEKIAFNSDRDGDWNVYVVNADGSHIARLTADAADDWAPSWSPDGKSIAYTSNQSGSYDIWRVLADGTDARAVTTYVSNEFDPAWSPEGHEIAFTSNKDSRDYRVYTVSSDGSGDATRLTNGPGVEWTPVWSPDGTRIAFLSSREGDLEVYAMSADGSGVTNLTRNPGADDGWGGLSWSRDGGSILYASQGALPAWRTDWVRQNLGAASILLQAALLAGLAIFALRRGPLPFGALTLIVALPAVLATVLTDEYRFIPAAIVAGLLADLLVMLIGYGVSRRRDAAVAFAIPSLFYAAYFVTIGMTVGIGWSIHLWLGAIVLAGIVGLLLDELGRTASLTTGSLRA